MGEQQIDALTQRLERLEQKIGDSGTTLKHSRGKVFWKTLVLSLFVISVANAYTPRQIAQKALPSVVLLVMEDANGQSVSLGSGFFVSDGVIANKESLLQLTSHLVSPSACSDSALRIMRYTRLPRLERPSDCACH